MDNKLFPTLESMQTFIKQIQLDAWDKGMIDALKTIESAKEWSMWDMTAGAIYNAIRDERDNRKSIDV